MSRGQEEKCSLCPGDSQVLDRPSYLLDHLPDIPPGTTCQTFATFLPVIFSKDSLECHQTHLFISALCGCPREDYQQVKEPCILCDDDHRQNLEAPLSSLPELSYIFQDAITEPTCEVVQAYLQTNIEKNHTECNKTLSVMADRCRCSTALSDNDTVEDKVNELPSSEDLGTLLQNPCTICPSGDKIAEPNKVINYPGIPLDSCGQLDSSLQSVASDSDECYAAQGLFSTYCGCPKPQTQPCSICPNGEFQPPNPNSLVESMAYAFQGIPPTCEIYSASVQAFDARSVTCYYAQGVGVGDCGCKPIENHCTACPGGIPEEYIDEVLTFGTVELGCEALENGQYAMSRDEWDCFYLQNQVHKCGCREGICKYIILVLIKTLLSCARLSQVALDDGLVFQGVMGERIRDSSRQFWLGLLDVPRCCLF